MHEAGSDGLGHVWQSAVPTQPRDDGRPVAARGLHLRGVVIAVYVYDTPATTPGGGAAPGQRRAIYCDVLIYSRIAAYHGQVVAGVLVPQGQASIHDGDVVRPRAARIDISGAPVGRPASTNPANLDGSHVLIGFIDDDLGLPWVAGFLPHPSADAGTPPVLSTGHRVRLTEADGEPRLVKHHGSFGGIDGDGNLVVDLTRAHDGQLAGDGTERPGAERPDGERLDQAGAAKHGKATVRLPRDARVTIAIDGGPTFTLEAKGGDAKLTVGDGAESVALAHRLAQLYDALKTKLDAFDGHQHAIAGVPIAGSSATGGAVTGTATGTTGLPAPTIAAPAWDPKIESTRVTLPDEP